MEEFNSYKDYAQAVIEDIIALEKTFPTKEQLPLDLLTYWCEEINKHAEIYWNEYLIGKRDSYMFDQDEFKEIYDKFKVTEPGIKFRRSSKKSFPNIFSISCFVRVLSPSFLRVI